MRAARPEARRAGWLALAVIATLAPGSVLGDPLGYTLPATARQLVVVTAADWASTSGTLQRWRRAQAGWVAVGGEVPVRLGRRGLAWGAGLDAALDRDGAEPRKQEGDARAPAGVFELGPAFGELPRFVHGTRLGLRAITHATRCVDDPASSLYNQLTERGEGYRSAESMAGGVEYSLGVVVAHNAAPVRAGAGSCIFLHVWAAPQVSTPGCTSMSAGDLTELLGWLDAGERPLLVQLPRAVYGARRAAWTLP